MSSSVDTSVDAPAQSVFFGEDSDMCLGIFFLFFFFFSFYFIISPHVLMPCVDT